LKRNILRSALPGALLVLAMAVGCASSSSDPAAMAEKITRAVYANDFDATTADFDDDLKGQVTRAEVGAISDKLHDLGDFKQFSQRSANADTGRYDYDVTLDRGSVVVQLRLDPSGKVGAYRVVTAMPAGSN
jgi:hypothetical protein